MQFTNRKVVAQGPTPGEHRFLVVEQAATLASNGSKLTETQDMNLSSLELLP